MRQPLGARYQSGSQVALALNPVRGIRDQQAREGKQPVDHGRRNLEALKETQRKVQEQRQAIKEAQQSSPEPFKMKKFQNVSSKVFSSKTTDSSPRSEDEPAIQQHHDFLRKGKSTATAAAKKTPSPKNNNVETPVSARSREGTPQRKPPVPKPTELNSLAPRSSKNFISENAREVAEKEAVAKDKLLHEMERERRRSDPKHAHFGQVPDYLVKMNAQRMKEKALEEEKADPACPPGMVRVSEDERLRTLDVLKQSADATRNELRKFPLSINSVAQRNRRADLEAKLQEQESAIDLFSKPKVFILA